MTVVAVTSLLAVGVVPVAFATEVDAPAVVDAELPLDTEPGATVAGDAGDADRTAALEAPITFSALWAELPEGLDAIRVRTSADGTDWSGWSELESTDLDPDEGPDDGSAEAGASETAPRVSELLETEVARYVQVEGTGDHTGEVTLRLVDADGLNESLLARLGRHLSARASLPAAEASSVPSWVKPRSAWGAAAYRGTPSVSRSGAQQVVLHHTAGRNDLRRADGSCDDGAVAGRIRAYQHWHQNGQGWSDIGYNLLIDPCGGVWEGRAGGLDRAVIGAHARNFNTGSVGISVMGNYEGLTPNADILAALDRVVGWKAGLHGIDTTGTVWRNGASHQTVVGHRNVGQTACPGRIMNSIQRIRDNARVESSRWHRVADGLGAARFPDTAGNAHAVSIERLVEEGITEGFPDGTFRPQAEITRAQVATFLSRALKLAPVAGDRFEDVPSGYVHGGAINALVDAGVLNGYGADFAPEEPLRREHMAAILARALGLEAAPDVAAQFDDLSGYVDEIGAIAAAGITSGQSRGVFAPKASVTRGQMATFLVNALTFIETTLEPPVDPAPPADPAPPVDPTPPADPTPPGDPAPPADPGPPVDPVPAADPAPSDAP